MYGPLLWIIVLPHVLTIHGTQELLRSMKLLLLLLSVPKKLKVEPG